MMKTLHIEPPRHHREPIRFFIRMMSAFVCKVLRRPIIDNLLSSLGRGAGRAWGLVCTLAVFCFCMTAPAMAVPPGTVISNTVQAAYRSWGTPATASSNTVTFTTDRLNTPSQIEFLQYAPTATGATPILVPTTAYSDTGTTSSSVTISAIYPAGSASPIDTSVPVPLINAGIYHQSEPIFLRVDDMDQNLYPTVADAVWVIVNVPGTGEAELLLLTETGPDTGVFMGYIQSGNLGAGSVDDFNGLLDVQEGGQLEARYTDAFDAADTVLAAAQVDPFGVVFDSATGLPVDNAQLTLVVDATGAPATVYGDDGVSTFPSTITSGGTFVDGSGKVYVFTSGRYRFPFVAPGTYRLVVAPPSGFAAPSTVPTATLQTLPGGPFVIADPGSRGEAFVLNPGPAIRMDIPVDPAATGLWLQKSVNREIAAIGDFVQYTVVVENRSGALAPGAVVTDILPMGFRFRKGSFRLNGAAQADPQISTDGRTLTFTIGNLAADAATRIHYVTEIAAATPLGKAENRASATAAGGLSSNSATAVVKVKEDLIRTKNFIIGRVIADNCTDKPTDLEDGIAGVRIYLEDGRYVVTDAQGRYHFEGLSSGTHVVQIDLETLPEMYEPALCEDDTRTAATPFSRFVELYGGTLRRADFHVQTKTPPSVKTHWTQKIASIKCEDSVAADTQGEHVGQSNPPGTEEKPADVQQDIGRIDLEALSPGFAVVMPQSGFLPAAPGLKLAVKHGLGERVDLLHNGQPVSPFHFQGQKYNAARTVALSIWRGVDLKEGDNHFIAICKDGNGAEKGRVERSVHYSGPPVKAEWVAPASRLVANGKDRPLIAIRFTDKDGYPVRRGIVGTYHVLPPHQAYVPKPQEDREPLAAQERAEFMVGADGIARLKLEPTTVSGYATVTIPMADRDQAFRVWLRPELRDWILVGLAEGTAGYNTVSGNMENLTAGDREDAFYQDGRVAFFAKGRIKGKWLLTAAYDSGREREDNDTGLFQTVDPDTYYTLYGDAAQQQNEAASIRKLYLKVERDQFYALFGDYDTGLTVTELSKYSRRFNGIKSEYRGGGWEFTAFATDSDQAFIKDELRGDGTSGLYRLSRKNIVPNSETVTIETRDRFRSEIIISSQTLARHIDYSIDTDAGTLFFKSPVYSRDAGFNPIFIVVDYESRDTAESSYSYGGRGSVQLAGGKVEVGTTYVHEGQGESDTDLAGVDTRIEFGDGLTARAEVAATRKDDFNGKRNGHAMLAEVSQQSDRLSGKVYYREQGEDFGLGQQNGSEAATRKLGADAAWRMNDTWRLSGELYRQHHLTTEAERDLGEARVEFHRPVYDLYSGLRLAEDRLGSEPAQRSTQLLAGASRRFMDNRLNARISHEQSLSGSNESVDFPTRTTIGVDYKLADPVTLFAEHEIARGESETSQSSRLGVKATPWSGGQLGSSVGREYTESGHRLFANLGLNQTWRISDRWSIDGGLDRTQTFDRSAAAPFNTNVPTAAGAEEDFTSVSLGAAYRAQAWSWTGRLESRTADSEDKWGLITGIAGEVRPGLALSAGVSIFDTGTLAGSDTRDGDIRFSLAFRPKNTRWIVLDRLDHKFEQRRDADGAYNARRIVNNLNANYQPHHKLQVALQYGAKYVFDTFDDRSYSGYTDLTGFDLRYDITRRWDAGLHVSLLHSWDAGQVDYRTGCSVGYAVMKNMWVSLGYNFTGFKDEDFSAADYTAAGPFLKMRIKFDQQSVKEMVSWFDAK